MNKMDKKYSYFVVFIVLGLCLFLGFLQFYLRRERPLVSAILVNQLYDHTTVKKLLHTYLKQTVSNVEVIVVNVADGDDLELEELYKNEKRISFYSGSSNMTQNVNIGLEKARGEYIYFMHPSVLPVQDQIEQQQKYFKQNPEVHAVGAQVKDDAVPLVLMSHSAKESQIRTLFQLPVSYYATLIKRDFITSHHLKYDESLPVLSGLDFWQRFIQAGGQVINSYDELFYQSLPAKPQLKRDPITGLEFSCNSVLKSADLTQIKATFSTLLSKYLKTPIEEDRVVYPVNVNASCFLLNQLDSKGFDEHTFKFLKKRLCLASDIKTYPIIHKQWHDTIKIYPDNRACLIKQGSCGAIQWDNNVLSIKWYSYGTETFVLRIDGALELKKP